MVFAGSRSRLCRSALDDEMALQTNTVNAHTVGLHKLDDALGAEGLCFAVLEVVIVVVEFGGRVDGGSVLESKRNVGGADDAVEDAIAERTVFLEGYQV